MSGRKGSLREERSSTVRAVGLTRTGRAGGRGGARRTISPYSQLFFTHSLDNAQRQSALVQRDTGLDSAAETEAAAKARE